MKKLKTHAENARALEKQRLSADEEVDNTLKAKNTHVPVRMTEEEYNTLLSYIQRNNYSFINSEIGDIVDDILTPRTTEFFKLLPDAVLILAKANRTDIVNAIKPIVNSLVVLKDWDFMIYDIIEFFGDLAEADKNRTIKMLKHLTK